MKFDFSADARLIPGPGSTSKQAILEAAMALGTAAAFVPPTQRPGSASPARMPQEDGGSYPSPGR